MIKNSNKEKYIIIPLVISLLFGAYQWQELKTDRDNLWCELNCDTYSFVMNEEREVNKGNTLWQHVFPNISTVKKMLITWNYLNITGITETNIIIGNTELKTKTMNGSIEIELNNPKIDVIIYVMINDQNVFGGSYTFNLFVWQN